MIRLVVVLIVVLFYLIISIPILLVNELIKRFSVETSDKLAQGMIKFYLRTIGFLAGAKVTYKGLENIPKDQAVMYVGNHASYFDIVLSYPVLPGVAGFVAKKELLKVPMLAQIMKAGRCLFLDRDNMKEGLKTILQAIEFVKSGISLFIFPEGTRSKDGQMADFKEGSMKIATKSGCPIVPVAFSNTSAIFEDHFPIIKKSKIIIEFGEPIYSKELPAEEQKHLGKKLHDVVLEMRDRNNAEL